MLVFSKVLWAPKNMTFVLFCVFVCMVLVIAFAQFCAVINFNNISSKMREKDGCRHVWMDGIVGFVVLTI